LVGDERLQCIRDSLWGIVLDAGQEGQLVLRSPVVADEIEHDQPRLALINTQTPAELLNENRHRFRGPEKHDEVDARNVDAL
jgi:hypothetical protein